MILPIQFAAAKAAGLVRYFTGKPCVRGHIAERTVSNRSCVKCQSERVQVWQKQNSAKVSIWAKKAQLNFRERKPGRSRQIKAKYREQNRAAIQEKNLDYFRANRERYAANKKRYRAEKPWVHAENQKAREATKRHAMPHWVDRDAIKAIYKLAEEATRRTGIKHSVDHIYPLRGKTSCGLHVPWNLQVIPLSENCSKGNKLPH